MFEWTWLYFIITVVITGFSPVLYRLVRKIWPSAPYLIQSLWFIVAALGVVGAPVALIFQLFPSYAQNAYWNMVFSYFMVYSVAVLIAAVLVTFAAWLAVGRKAR